MAQEQLEIERHELSKRIGAFGGDDAEFTKIAAAALILAGLYRRDDEFRRHMAGRCEVAMSTIDRWGTGDARPHPRLFSRILGEAAKFFQEISK